MITITTKSYNTGDVEIDNGVITINGEAIEHQSDDNNVHITITGNVSSLKVSGFKSLKVTGDVTGNVEGMDGSMSFNNVLGNVDNMNGDIHCGSVGGNVSNANGNIIF